MKHLYHKILFTLFGFVAAFSLSTDAQITTELVTETSFEGNISDTYTHFTMYIEVTNIGDAPIQLKWTMNPDGGCNADWGWVACDNVLCYSEGTMSNLNEDNAGFTYDLDAGESHEYSVKVYPHTVNGCCSIEVDFEDFNNLGTVIETISLDVGVNDDSCLVTDIEDLADVSASFFPNPTNGVLNIDSNHSITEVVVYDLIGNEIMTVVGEQINSIDLSELGTGAYLLAASARGFSEPFYQRVLKH